MKSIFLIFTFISFRSFAEVGLVADVTLNPMGSFKAKTADVQGAATVSGDVVTAENIVVNMKSIETGIGLRDNHARNKYMEVEKYPEAILIKGTGKGGVGTGTLRFHGVEHEVSGKYLVSGGTVTATFPIKLSDFKIGDVSYKGIGVEDTVNVAITVPAKMAVGPEKAVAPPHTKPKR